MNRKTPLARISLTVAIILAIGAMLWITIPNQPSGEYGTIGESLSKIKQTSDEITNVTSTPVFVHTINNDFVTSYEERVENLAAATKNIDSNPLIQEDDILHDIYNKHRSNLLAYVASNESLLSSLKLFTSASAACSDMGYALDNIRKSNSPMTADVFSTNAQECQQAISAAEKASDQQTRKQFLNTYLDYMTVLLEAYKQEFTAGTNTKLKQSSRTTIETMWGEVLGVGQTTTTLTRSPDISQSIKDLEDIVNQRKTE